MLIVKVMIEYIREIFRKLARYITACHVTYVIISLWRPETQ
jgi:hypothetical protein